MHCLTNVVIVPTLVVALLTAVSTVVGCGLMPLGQSSTRSFNITGFKLPVAMVFSGMVNNQAQAPGIATSMEGAQAFVRRVIMQAVFDVLERQGRGAGLSDAIIGIILGQLTVQTTYTPLDCPNVLATPIPPAGMNIMENQVYCIIVGSTLTAICRRMAGGNQMCVPNAGTNVMPIPNEHLSIGGTFTTTNVIMANWSREMWQSVVDRVVRTLASGPFGENFISASATVT